MLQRKNVAWVIINRIRAHNGEFNYSDTHQAPLLMQTLIKPSNYYNRLLQCNKLLMLLTPLWFYHLSPTVIPYSEPEALIDLVLPGSLLRQRTRSSPTSTCSRAWGGRKQRRPTEVVHKRTGSASVKAAWRLFVTSDRLWNLLCKSAGLCVLGAGCDLNSGVIFTLFEVKSIISSYLYCRSNEMYNTCVKWWKYSQ